MGFPISLVFFIFNIINIILTVYMWIIIIKALVSWVNPDPYNPIIRFLDDVTEPVLRKVRAVIPIGNIGIDLSPIIVIFAIYILQMLFAYLENDIVSYLINLKM
ncbi:MAG: YggT family protein [Candidatus Acididesulfobacter diazotrophicus]|uniref:YggT family protein n=1 Tax=Candidatus Acididesulfobacter diazotrophicus TaxID=2597226 RepID=A0A519BKQ5_9DELT|nr:MAG: YggT family protein [Candidatus Acididesulfobacter diazotrophicus]